MSNLQLPGLFTGIDTNSLISQLMAIERRSLSVYQQRQTLWEQKRDALDKLESKLSNLRSTARALADADGLRAFNTSSSDEDKITAEASNNAFEGNHTIVVNQLANAERWVHTTGVEYAEDYVGAGTFIYSYNNKEASVTTTATTTLEDLVGQINNDANNPGVTASLLYYNRSYHMVLNGDDAGSDYKITVNSASTEIWESDSAFTSGSDNATLGTKITALDQYTANSGLQGDEQIQITGTDHDGNAIAQVNLTITDNTKISHLVDEINDAFEGIAVATFENGKISLTDKSSDTSSLSLTLTYDAGSGDTTLTGLGVSVSAEGGSTTADLANFTASDFTKSQSAQDSKIKVDGFPSSLDISEVQTMSLTAGNPNNGHYHITYEGQTTGEIAFNADKDVIQTAINALSNVNSGDIIVTETGSAGIDDGDVIFTFSDTMGDVSMLTVDYSALTGPGADPTLGVTETTKGVDAYISRSSNTVDDVIYGVTLHLHDTTTDSGEEITLTRDIASVKSKLSKMVDSYNLAVDYIKETTGYNTIVKTGGVLMGDYVVSTIRNKLVNPVVSQTSGFIEDFDAFRLPGQIGLELDRDGLLNLDSDAFDEAISEDYLGVLALIGANKTGTSSSDTVEFYGASSDYTTAGTYDVQVQVTGGVITSAQIKLESESVYRNATYSGNIVTGDSTFGNNGDPVYPENAMQLSVDLTQDGTFNATVRIKQGFASEMEDELDKMLRVTIGSIPIDQDHVDDQLELLKEKIESEQYRLDKREARLVGQFARLEKTLTLIQNQMSALGMMSM
ncbi:MAG: flagellar filament capping protein FliD [Planctomycetota bacterium]|jgi:flagellar hook-associated protein 2